MKCPKGHIWENCTCDGGGGGVRFFAKVVTVVGMLALVSLIWTWKQSGN